MPNKTIYVAEEDLPLLEQAQALTGGNLSAAVAQALRGFVDAARAREAGFDDVTVRVGPRGAKRLKRFRGYQVAAWQMPQADGRQMEFFTVYRTQGGRFAVHWHKGPDWGWWADPAAWAEMCTEHGFVHYRVHERHDPRHDLRNRKYDHGGGQAHEETLEVYETLDALKEHIPPELYEIVTEAEREPRLEVLDI